MEEISKNNSPDPQEAAQSEGYVPRPAGQVWLARLGLLIAIVLVISQIVSIARGGL